MGHDDDVVLRPVPQTEEAFGALRAYADDRLHQQLEAMGRKVRGIAPGCVALSLSLIDSGLTFTLAADSEVSALMDAVQYLDGGPCVTAMGSEETLSTTVEPKEPTTDEALWQLFGQAARHAGIASTLSFPVLEGETVVAGINLYGESLATFDGRHQELAHACGAWWEGAVTNADLGFASRVRAAATPQRLLERHDVDIAAGLVAVAQDVAASEALSRIASAATRAGVTEVEFARFLLDAHAADHGRRAR